MTDYFGKLLKLSVGEKANIAGMCFMAFAFVDVDIMGVVIDIPDEDEPLVFMSGVFLTLLGIVLILTTKILERRNK